MRRPHNRLPDACGHVSLAYCFQHFPLCIGEVQNHIITKGGAKPIVFHISDLGQFNNLYHILPIANILSLCNVPTISIIDGPMSAMCLLFSIVCHRRYIYEYSYVSVDFVHYSESNVKLGDTLYNTKMFLSLILSILRRYTKLPNDILQNIFKNKMLKKIIAFFRSEKPVQEQTAQATQDLTTENLTPSVTNSEETSVQEKTPTAEVTPVDPGQASTQQKPKRQPSRKGQSPKKATSRKTKTK